MTDSIDKGYGTLHEIEALRSALRSARWLLVTIGGDGAGDDGDAVQRAVLHEIDTALAITDGEPNG